MKRVINHILAVARLRYKVLMGADYKKLNNYILKINQLRDIDRILHETARCLKDILNYELYGFALKDGNAVDVWVDPSAYKTPLIDIIQGELEGQKIDFNVHYFNKNSGENGHNPDGFDVTKLLSYTVSGNARLYLVPGRRMFYYHSEIMDIIVRTLGIALDNAMNIKRLERAMITDPLTNCYNRRALMSYLEHDIAHVKRHGGHLSVIMFDLDHFKTINDLYGHQAGDRSLRETAETVRSMIRKSDYLARYGGEEFIIVLRNTKFRSAVELAERIRQKLEVKKIHLDDRDINITASFGVATFKEGSDIHRLLQEADEMLYRAKATRNKVVPCLKTYFSDIPTPYELMPSV
jgi:diguanylate cyclase (GGDEF)-like protein